MPVRTRRWNDPAQPGDGTRLLVTRYRPRALPKADETWDEWRKELSPSPELLAAFQGKRGPRLPWRTFAARYRAEMRERTEEIALLAARLRSGETLTLLCSSSCVDETRCHRTLLRALLEQAVGR